MSCLPARQAKWGDERKFAQTFWRFLRSKGINAALIACQRYNRFPAFGSTMLVITRVEFIAQTSCQMATDCSGSQSLAAFPPRALSFSVYQSVTGVSLEGFDGFIFGSHSISLYRFPDFWRRAAQSRWQRLSRVRIHIDQTVEKDTGSNWFFRKWESTCKLVPIHSEKGQRIRKIKIQSHCLCMYDLVAD